MPSRCGGCRRGLTRPSAGTKGSWGYPMSRQGSRRKASWLRPPRHRDQRLLTTALVGFAGVVVRARPTAPERERSPLPAPVAECHASVVSTLPFSGPAWLPFRPASGRSRRRVRPASGRSRRRVRPASGRSRRRVRPASGRSRRRVRRVGSVASPFVLLGSVASTRSSCVASTFSTFSTSSIFDLRRFGSCRLVRRRVVRGDRFVLRRVGRVDLFDLRRLGGGDLFDLFDRCLLGRRGLSESRPVRPASARWRRPVRSVRPLPARSARLVGWSRPVRPASAR